MTHKITSAPFRLHPTIPTQSLRPKFSSVPLYDGQLSSYAPPFFGKVHWMTPNDLDMSGQKYQYACYMHTPGTQFFVRFSLRWAIFELRPYFGKCAPNDPKITLTCYRSKVHICILYTSRSPKYSSFSLYDEPFSRKLRFLIPHWLQCKN